jgi:ElaB/YqjD/DUF883 family membrane-anchored ribosome-binding protein
MIKTFEQFINETTAFDMNEEYGAPFFNKVSESLIAEIYKSINEGRLVINTNMIEENLFDTIGNAFKKSADKVSDKIEDDDKNATEKSLSKIIDYIDGENISDWDKDIKPDDIDDETYKKIESLCESAKNICNDFAENEDKKYKTISEKMSAANESIKKFMQIAISTITGILEISTNIIITSVYIILVFCRVMAAIVIASIKALAAISIVSVRVLAFTLPIVLAFSIYKGVLKVCETLVEKINGGSKIVKDVFVKIKASIVKWIVDSLKKAKDALKKSCDAAKDGAKKVYQNVGKAFITIAAMIGQLASDAKDEISKAYIDFINGAKEFTNDVKEFISEKWGVVSNWCKNAGTAFAEGIKNVWSKIKDKVANVTDSIKESHNYSHITIKPIVSTFDCWCKNICENNKHKYII